MSLLSAELLEKLARQPIPGPNPAGANVRLEASFESIEREIAKLDSLTAEDPVRWRDVLAISQQILEQESKDFLVACYLTRALCENHVLDGLQQGLNLTHGIVAEYWEQAYPPVKRVRGRAQAFEWLVEKCNPLLEKYEPHVSHLEKIKSVETLIVALDSTLVDKMAEHAPNLADLRQRFRRMRHALETEAQIQARRQDAARVPVSQSTGTGTDALEQVLQTTASIANVSIQAPGSIAADKDVMAVYRACQEPLRAVSQYLRTKKLADPEAYRISRFITWLGINQLPAAVDGKTQLKSVPKDKVAACQALLAEQRWHDVVPEIETSLSRAPYWLDGQRLVSEALQGLNAHEAQAAVIDGVRGFVSRFPQVVNYSFSDGVPFADEQTRLWISREVTAGHQSGVSTDIQIDQAGISAQWQDAYEQATRLAKDKRLRDAMALFQTGCTQSTSLREQALWRFNQARFCFENGLLSLAIPLLEDLDQQLTEKGVADWEPQLTTKILELLVRCYREDSARVPEKRVEALHARLCKHDLALAFDLSNH